MKNNVQLRSIIASLLFICSYTQTMLCSQGLPERERKMSRTQIDQLEQMLTPLHFAKTVQEVTEILKYGPDINAQDINGFTPLQYMLEDNHLAAVTYLLEQGAHIKKDDLKKYVKLLKQECILRERK